MLHSILRIHAIPREDAVLDGCENHGVRLVQFVRDRDAGHYGLLLPLDYMQSYAACSCHGRPTLGVKARNMAGCCIYAELVLWEAEARGTKARPNDEQAKACLHAMPVHTLYLSGSPTIPCNQAQDLEEAAGLEGLALPGTFLASSEKPLSYKKIANLLFVSDILLDVSINGMLKNQIDDLTRCFAPETSSTTFRLDSLDKIIG